MAIPNFQAIMLPLLKLVSDRQEHSFSEVIPELANEFKLTEHEREEMLPSGQETLFHNRVGWAKTYLSKASLIEGTRRGYFHITDAGTKVTQQNLEKIDIKFLTQFIGFNDFLGLNKKKPGEIEIKGHDNTPKETLENAYQNLRNNLANDLLEQLMKSPPSLFEKIVVELLVKMGYGGNQIDAGQALGKAGDGGIDGTIKEDKLGLDIIYIQAKRWNNPVGRPEIQKFAGALQGERAKKGVFITTAVFSPQAVDYAHAIDSKIVLIDGKQLADFMIDYNIGVSVEEHYEIKRLDYDYFEE